MEDTLVSMLENRPSDCEILVVHNEPYADPYDLKSEVCFLEAPRDSRWVDSINLGLAVSRAPIVHLLTCDVRASDGWTDEALVCFHDATVGVVTPWVMDRDRPDRVVSAGARWRAGGLTRRRVPWRTRPLPAAGEALVDPDLPVAFYRKSALDLAGRFSAQVGDRLACVDMGLTLQQLGYRSLVQPRCQVHGRRAARAVTESALRRGWAEERMFWRWLPRSGKLRGLPAHGLLLALQAAQSIVRPSNVLRLVGHTLGLLPLPPHDRHWQAVEQLRRENPPPVAEPKPSASAPHFHRSPAHAADRRARATV